nr:hypothetical protein Q903MT_gene1536 [Picea sitchensis]
MVSEFSLIYVITLQSFDNSVRKVRELSIRKGTLPTFAISLREPNREFAYSPCPQVEGIWS